MESEAERSERKFPQHGILPNIDKTTPGGFVPSNSGFKRGVLVLTKIWAILMVALLAIGLATEYSRSAEESKNEPVLRAS